MQIHIDETDYKAIMTQAVRAYHREEWMRQAVESSDSAGEYMERKFSPYAARLVEKTKFDMTGDNVEKVKLMFFSYFTDLVIN